MANTELLWQYDTISGKKLFLYRFMDDSQVEYTVVIGESDAIGDNNNSETFSTIDEALASINKLMAI